MRRCALRQDENAGAMPREFTRPRGGAQTEVRDGAPRVAGESWREHSREGIARYKQFCIIRTSSADMV